MSGCHGYTKVTKTYKNKIPKESIEGYTKFVRKCNSEDNGDIFKSCRDQGKDLYAEPELSIKYTEYDRMGGFSSKSIVSCKTPTLTEEEKKVCTGDLLEIVFAN